MREQDVIIIDSLCMTVREYKDRLEDSKTHIKNLMEEIKELETKLKFQDEIIKDFKLKRK